MLFNRRATPYCGKKAANRSAYLRYVALGMRNWAYKGKRYASGGLTPYRVKKAAHILPILSIASILAAVLSGCGTGGKLYTIQAEGALAAPGVMSYLGYTMNVYADQASNPCGGCARQPVSLFVGDDAEAVVAAIARALEADFWGGGWAVESAEGATLRVKAASGIAREPSPPTAPDGLIVKGGFRNRLRTGSISPAQAGASAQVRNIKQFDGVFSTVPLIPQRIAAVYGPSYEALALLGAEDRIVARADVQTANFPWAEEVFGRISGLPVLEDVHAAVSIEQLLTNKPDLVYSFPRPNETAMLDKAGVAWIKGAATRSLSDVKELLRVFASGIGAQAQERAGLYALWFDEKLAFVTGRTASLDPADRPKVYYAGTDILTTYGRYSDIIEVIEAAGGMAVTRELEGGNRINTDAEKLADWNPDWIFIDHCGMSGGGGSTADEVVARAYANKKYAGIAAFRDRQVVLTPSGVFYWDMGLQKILLVEYMSKTLHPDLFADLDMAAEVQDFYRTFFGYPLTYGQAEKILAREAP